MTPPPYKTRKNILLLAAANANLLILSSCSTTTPTGDWNNTAFFDPGYGPFDRNGNYIEALADQPGRQLRVANYNINREDQNLQLANNPTPSAIDSRPAAPQTANLAAKTTAPSPSYKKPAAPKPKVQIATTKRLHLISKGDTLYGLSRRYKTSIGAIQKLNGLSGTNIILGKTLKIPR